MATVIDVLESLGVQTWQAGESKHVRPGWVGIDCPQCGPGSQRAHLGINLAKVFATCWQCGKVNLVEALAEASNNPYQKVRSLLEGVARERLPEPVARGKLMPPPGITDKLMRTHRRYLERRNLDPAELVEKWGVRSIGMEGGRWSWRLYIPVVLNGRPVSWTTRSVGEGVTPAYLSAAPDQEAMDHKCLLLGEDMVKHAIVVHEGPMDAMATGPGAVCTFGLGYRRSQVLRIAEYPVRVICFDSQPPAQRRAAKLCNDLAVFPGETHQVTLTTGKDACEASKSEIKELRRRFLE